MASVGKIYRIKYLPNTEGLQFIAIYDDGTEKLQVVKKNENGTHYIDNFNRIKNWKRYYGEI